MPRKAARATSGPTKSFPSNSHALVQAAGPSLLVCEESVVFSVRVVGCNLRAFLTVRTRISRSAYCSMSGG